MTNRTGLSKAASAGHRHIGVEVASILGQFKWLANNHTRHFAAKVLVNGPAINRDVTATIAQKHARG